MNETDERAIALGAPFYCQICGESERLRWIQDVQERLAHHRLCYSCDFWVQRWWLHQTEPERSVICRGEAYTVGPPGQSFRGYGGRTWTVVWRDGRTTVTSNLWHQGTVPEHFRHLLPDDAELNSGKVAAL